MNVEISKIPITLRDYFFHDPFFKANWHKFDELKESVVKVSKEVLNKFRGFFQTLAYMPFLGYNKEESEVEIHHFPRKWMLPSLPELQDNKDALEIYRDLDNELIRFQETKDELEITLDTHIFKPDEISVTVDDGQIVVVGYHKDEMDDGKRSTLRQFRRKYVLPAGLDQKDVVSNLSKDGVLVITARRGVGSKPVLEALDADDWVYTGYM